MRTRKELEKEAEHYIEKSDNVYRVIAHLSTKMFEVLLDIRDLLEKKENKRK